MGLLSSFVAIPDSMIRVVGGFCGLYEIVLPLLVIFWHTNSSVDFNSFSLVRARVTARESQYIEE